MHLERLGNVVIEEGASICQVDLYSYLSAFTGFNEAAR